MVKIKEGGKLALQNGWECRISKRKLCNKHCIVGGETHYRFVRSVNKQMSGIAEEGKAGDSDLVDVVDVVDLAPHDVARVRVPEHVFVFD